MFNNATKRASIIKDNPDAASAEFALSLLGDDAGEDSRADVRGWAGALVRDASKDDWETALRTPQGDPRLNVALALSGTRDVPSGLSDLADALHSHFEAITNGVAVWQPDAATFTKLARLLPANTRRTLASQLCAELEVETEVLEPDW